MIYGTGSKNPLAVWYRCAKRYAKNRNSPISPEFETWRGFAKWCNSQGWDENVKLHYSSFDPFTPDYVYERSGEDYPFEYIAYDARDRYELIITSAPTVPELSNKLHNLGYEYGIREIHSSISRNKEERPIEEREWGLIFEKIDLRNYNEDGEPFEERNCVK